MWVFTCTAAVDGVEKVFELKYDVEGAVGCFLRFKEIFIEKRISSS